MLSPSATYRVQFNKEFGFPQARALVPFLSLMGISTLYASPILEARQGSTHGYDVTNPARLNPELGSPEDFASLVAELQAHGLSLLVDIVPNHMAVSEENPWWTDVLENGAGSPYAGFFDVRWELPTQALPDQIYLATLGDPFGKALEWGHLQVRHDDQGVALNYYSHRFPLDPSTYDVLLGDEQTDLSDEAANAALRTLRQAVHNLPARGTTDFEFVEVRRREKETIKQSLAQALREHPSFRRFFDQQLALLNGTPGKPESFDRLEQLLQRQPYRLAHWKSARELINYRRFFDVADLVSMRTEQADVFQALHQWAVGAVAQGQVQGLRIDHIDGLYDPQSYLEQLQTATAGVYTVVEKITLGTEDLPHPWHTAGTTGYDFLGAVNGVLTDPAGVATLDRFYRELTGRDEEFATVMYRNKRRVMDDLFAGEVLRFARQLAALAEDDRHARDVLPSEFQRVLAVVTASFPVYRTYTTGAPVSPADRAVIEQAFAAAQEREPADPEAYRFLRRVLLLEDVPADRSAAWVRFVMRWQQFTGPVMAKGVEDTSFYQYNRLVSLNEVGGDLSTFAPEEFHAFQQRRQQHWPHTLNASSTHDTKRSEDVRARLQVLSELAPAWTRTVARWRRWNADLRPMLKGCPVPGVNEEYLHYQTLLGAWPLTTEDEASFGERLKAFIVKAAREAKYESSWLAPNEAYESGWQEFARAITAPDRTDQRFMNSFREWHERVSFYGMLNSLSALLLKMTCPGVPDFYQGTLLWDFSLVDPDNRRPIDFPQRMEFVAVLENQQESEMPTLMKLLLQQWTDGGVKLFLTYQTLRARRDGPELFSEGEYLPLAVKGSRADELLAFARRRGDEWAVILAPRFYTRLSVLRQPPVGRRIWRDTAVVLPAGSPHEWRSVITGSPLTTGDLLSVGDALRDFPVGLLRAG